MAEQNMFSSRMDLSDLTNAVSQIRQEIRKIIVGQQEMVDLLIVALLSNGGG